MAAEEYDNSATTSAGRLEHIHYFCPSDRCCSLIWSGTEWTAVPSEGGHISLAAHTQREFELIERMRGDRDHLSADRVLSGPGLATLYQAIEESEGALSRFRQMRC